MGAKHGLMAAGSHPYQAQARQEPSTPPHLLFPPFYEIYMPTPRKFWHNTLPQPSSSNPGCQQQDPVLHEG